MERTIHESIEYWEKMIRVCKNDKKIVEHFQKKINEAKKKI